MNFGRRCGQGTDFCTGIARLQFGQAEDQLVGDLIRTAGSASDAVEGGFLIVFQVLLCGGPNGGDFSRTFIIKLSRRCQLQTVAALAEKQLKAEIFFQCGKEMAQRGLCDKLSLRSFGQAALFYDGQTIKNLS